MKGEPRSQSLWVTTSDLSGKRLIIEPWGDQFEVQNGDKYQIMFNGPDDEVPLVDINHDGIQIYGWSGSTVSVFKDGSEMTSSGAVAVPRTPKQPE